MTRRPTARVLRWSALLTVFVVCACTGPVDLLTSSGAGHTAFGRSPCVGEFVITYLVDLVVPRSGTVCP